MTTPHPITEDDAILLNMYLSPGTALFAICEELDITYSQLERRLNQPHIREAIERAVRLHEQRAKTLARRHADDAIATLHHIAENPEHPPESRRKAAAKLMTTATAATPTVREGIPAPSPSGRGRVRATPSSPLPNPPMATPNTSEGITADNHDSHGAGVARTITENPLVHTRGCPSSIHPITVALSHPQNTSPPLPPANIRTFSIHPFGHPRITRTDIPTENPRPP